MYGKTNGTGGKSALPGYPLSMQPKTRGITMS
jgi:hypothetical protein